MPAGGYSPGIPQSEQPYTKWDADKDEVEVDFKRLDRARHMGGWFGGRKGVVLKVLLVLVTFLLGLALGYVLRRSVRDGLEPMGKCPYTEGYESYSLDLSRELSKFLSAANIDSNLKSYTTDFHITATKGNNKLEQRLKAQLWEYGVDDVTEATYHVLLSYANWEKENLVYLLDDQGEVVFNTSHDNPEQHLHPEIRIPYLAYAPNGTVQGELVYANYGETSDFNQLKMNGVSCQDSIVIMRYGKLYRGAKVENAMRCGAKGVILYTDPADVTQHFTEPEEAYPASWNLPGWAVRRGTILASTEGDPLTPGLPSTEGMYRLRQKDAKLPTIPAQPLGYDDAHKLMMFMTGPASHDFNGAAHRDVTFRMGPGYNGSRANWTVKLEVNNELLPRNVTNVIGVIRGHEEPDRYVIVGCHYDAWSYGAVDPNIGSAIMMEIVKAFGQMKAKGWRPRRTILFIHWDGEEHAMMGSYEWVEEHYKELAERTVAYINLDNVIRGNYTFALQATPEIGKLMLNITQMFPTVATGTDIEAGSTVYDTWVKRRNSDNDETQPRVDTPMGGSDEAAFLFLLGAPTLFPRYLHNPEELGVKGVPSYHTAIDTYDYYSRFVDPGCLVAHSMARVTAETTLRLASSTRLPLDIRELSQQTQIAFLELNVLTSSKPGVLETLQWAIGNFSKAALEFHDKFQQINLEDVLLTRSYNDRAMKASQAFIHPAGLPGRPQVRNILFAPSGLNGHSVCTFTGVRDAFALYDPSADDRDASWDEFLRQVSIAQLAVETASNSLKDVYS